MNDRGRLLRHHFKTNFKICKSNVCGHYGTDSHDRTGCLLREGCPCGIDADLLNGKGCYAPVPLFVPLSFQENSDVEGVDSGDKYHGYT